MHARSTPNASNRRSAARGSDRVSKRARTHTLPASFELPVASWNAVPYALLVGVKPTRSSMPIAPGVHVQAGAERSNVNGTDRLIQDRHSHWQCETGARQNGTSSFTPPFDPFPALETKCRWVFALFVPVLGTSFGGCRTQPSPRRHNRRFFWTSIAAAQEERKRSSQNWNESSRAPFSVSVFHKIRAR